jgi:hypothetical protein
MVWRSSKYNYKPRQERTEEHHMEDQLLVLNLGNLVLIVRNRNWLLGSSPDLSDYPAKLGLAVRFATPRIRFLSEPPPLQTTHTSIYENGKSSVTAPHPIRSKLGMSTLYGLWPFFSFQYRISRASRLTSHRNIDWTFCTILTRLGGESVFIWEVISWLVEV